MAKKKGKGGQKTQKKFSVKDYLRTKMRGLPIGKCYVSPKGMEDSEVTVFVTRQHPAGTTSVGMFLVDKYCCGVKDARLHFSMDDDELQEMLAFYDDRLGLQEVTYNEAHNLVYGAKEYAEEIGISPHKDFADAQYVLAEDTDDIPLIEYEFGHEGKPLLICNSMREIDYYRAQMLQVLKPEEFETLLLGSMPDPFDDDEEDDDDDLADEDEPETWSDPDDPDAFFTNSHSTEHLLEGTKKLAEDIKKLDDVRKVAFFMLMSALAKSFNTELYGISNFAAVADKAVHNYHRYGDVAFGESSELLLDVIQAIITHMPDQDFEGKYLTLNMAYAQAPEEISLMQTSAVRSIVDDTEDGENRLISVMAGWIKNTMECMKEMFDTDDFADDSKIAFNVYDLEDISEHWTKKGAMTHVRKVNAGFVSKNPETYHRRKVRESLDTTFVDEEDFMGLVITLDNMAMSCIGHVREGRTDQAYYILSNILSETLWTVCSGRFDQWIVDEGVTRTCLQIVLTNTMKIFSNMILSRLVDPEHLGWDYRNCLRLEIALSQKHDGFLDLHPMIYSIETILNCH